MKRRRSINWKPWVFAISVLVILAALLDPRFGRNHAKPVDASPASAPAREAGERQNPREDAAKRHRAPANERNG